METKQICKFNWKTMKRWEEQIKRKTIFCPTWTTVRKSPSLHSRKSTPTPKFLGTAQAFFVCHIGPNFQIYLIYAFIGCPQSVVAKVPFVSLYLQKPLSCFDFLFVRNKRGKIITLSFWLNPCNFITFATFFVTVQFTKRQH